MLKTVLSLAATAALSCSMVANAKPMQQKVNTARIIGGEVAQKDAWPFMVALVRTGRDAYNGQFCGGSFIGDRYVLTASHCVDGLTADDLFVVVGIHDLSNEGVEGEAVQVNNIYMHEAYDTLTMDRDVAILELAKTVSAAPLKLATPDIKNAINDGTLLTVMGWGNRQADPDLDGDYPAKLHQVDLPLVSNETCAAANGFPVTDNMMCAGFPEGGKDSCQGDSGGPIVTQVGGDWYQLGVVSFGPGCAQPNSYGVYANVSSFENWLLDKQAGVSLATMNDLGILYQGEVVSSQLQLSNFTGNPLTITGVELDAPAASATQILTNGCDSAVLAVNSSCSLTVEYVADVAGTPAVNVRVLTDHTLATERVTRLTSVNLKNADSALSAALDAGTEISWFTGGDADWRSESLSTAFGGSAAGNESISNEQAAYLMAVVEGKGTLSYARQVSSEADYDFLDVYVNGELHESLSGEQAFRTMNVELGEGVNKVTFAYIKDQSIAEGADRAHVDNVSFRASSANQSPGNLPLASSGGGGGGSLAWLLVTGALLVTRRLR